MKHLISKWLMVFSAVYCTFCLPFSSCLPVTECEVLAQTATEAPAGASAANAGNLTPSHRVTHLHGSSAYWHCL